MTYEELVIQIKDDARNILAYCQNREKEMMPPITIETGKTEFENISKKLIELGYTFKCIECWNDNIPLFAFKHDVDKYIKEIGIRGNSGRLQIMTRIGKK